MVGRLITQSGRVATSHLALGEPWHAVGYLEACLPLLRDLGLTRHEGLARHELDACHAELGRHELDACHAELAGARLLREGRTTCGRPRGAAIPPPASRRPWDPPKGTLSPYPRDKGRFTLCPGSTDSRAG
jgi:hypothetical protein